MAGSCVTIMTDKFHKIFILISVFCLISCETIQDIAGLTKPNLETDISNEIPELVLPPDFNKVARKGTRISSQVRKPPIFDNQFQTQQQSIRPQVTNYIAPKINLQSSPTPSDSLEKFKENKKFSIGQWVYGRYVQGFKQGNLYYRPIYDKGYNFSRRYIPDQNVSSFLTSPQENISEIREGFSPREEFNFRSLDNLPVID